MTTLATLREIFGQYFGQQFDDFGEDTLQTDIEKWDSTAHVGLVLEIERRFNIEFTPSELARLTSVGAIRALVDRKRPA
jgi:acyl carrier protein